MGTKSRQRKVILFFSLFFFSPFFYTFLPFSLSAWISFRFARWHASVFSSFLIVFSLLYRRTYGLFSFFFFFSFHSFSLLFASNSNDRLNGNKETKRDWTKLPRLYWQTLSIVSVASSARVPTSLYDDVVRWRPGHHVRGGDIEHRISTGWQAKKQPPRRTDPQQNSGATTR